MKSNLSPDRFARQMFSLALRIWRGSGAGVLPHEASSVLSVPQALAPAPGPVPFQGRAVPPLPSLHSHRGSQLEVLACPSQGTPHSSVGGPRALVPPRAPLPRGPHLRHGEHTKGCVWLCWFSEGRSCSVFARNYLKAR